MHGQEVISWDESNLSVATPLKLIPLPQQPLTASSPSGRVALHGHSSIHDKMLMYPILCGVYADKHSRRGGLVNAMSMLHAEDIILLPISLYFRAYVLSTSIS